MQTLRDLSHENGGGFVGSLEIVKKLDQDAVSFGLSGVLQRLESQGHIEHVRNEDGTGGDRPTAAGLAFYGL